MKPIKNYDEFINEAWIGPFVFNEDMTDDELKAIYQGALDGFAYWQKGFEYPKADYKKAYTEIGKILKKRGVNVDESVNEGSNDEMVKRSCVERLSQFFRVSPNALSHFKFDGTDNIKALTKALNSTSDEGTEAYYKVAIRVGKQDAGIEESIDESAKCPPIYIPVLSNTDHTRIIKWMDIHFDSHKWDMKKSGAGFEIDVEKLSSQEQDDLLKYLHAQDYLEESVNEAWSNIDTDKAADLINKEIGVNPGYFFIGDEDLCIKFDKLWTEKKYKVALNMLFFIENLKDLKDFIKQNQNESVNEAVSPEVHRMVNKFVKSMADKFDYPLQDAVYSILDVLKSQKYKGLKESVNEAETLIFDEIGENLFKLQDQIDSMLKWKITDQKWIVALKGIQSACSKLEDTVAKADQKLGALEYNESLREGLLKLDEGAIKQFEIDYKDMESSIKRGIGWIDPEYVAETWENSSDTIDYEIVRNEILTRLIKADLLYTSLDGETKGKRITNISQIK